MFPISNRQIVGYAFGVPTFYNDFHIGVDYADEGDLVFAPWNGVVKSSYGPEGGNTIHFKAFGKPELFRFLHLQKVLKTGEVKQGDIIGIVGHTGLVSPPGINGAHCHLDISKDGTLQLNNRRNFLNPETYNWGKGHMLVYKQLGNPTLYFACGNVLIPFATDYPSFLQDFSEATVIDLPQNEFAKFKISKLKVS